MGGNVAERLMRELYSNRYTDAIQRRDLDSPND
jgi:hypothetical protein